MRDKVDVEVERIISSPAITTSDDLKKSETFAYIEPVVLSDQYNDPLLPFTLAKSPTELSAITSPVFEIANPKKLRDFINEEIDLTFQIFDPFSTSKQKS